MSKQVVVQRILPLQPGITQPFSVLPTADVSYSIENTMIKPSPSSSSPSSSSTLEYKSSLTEENLSRMNNLSEDSSSNSMRSVDSNSSNSSSRNIENNSSTSEHSKCDSGIETCDITGGDRSHHIPSFNVVDIDEEENNRLRQKLNDDPGIQSLMEISLPSPIQMVNSADECKFQLKSNRFDHFF